MGKASRVDRLLDSKTEISVAEGTMTSLSMLLQNHLLTTKFYVPIAPGPLICRSRLTALLDKSLQYPLTLVSAPLASAKLPYLLAGVNHCLQATLGPPGSLSRRRTTNLGSSGQVF